jgi:hypothetical protein
MVIDKRKPTIAHSAFVGSIWKDCAISGNVTFKVEASRRSINHTRE